MAERLNRGEGSRPAVIPRRTRSRPRLPPRASMVPKPRSRLGIGEEPYQSRQVSDAISRYRLAGGDDEN